MGNLNETEKWEENIYQLETSDPVLGGADGISNRAPRQLANRTKWLKKKTEEAAQSLAEHVRSRNHPDATLTAKGFTQLSSATNSTSETLAATPKAVKAAYDLAAGKAPASHTHPWSQITGVPAASLTAKGTVQLSSATDSQSETEAATPKAVKAAYDLAAGKAPVSHTHPWSQITGVPAASLTAKGTVQLSSAINSTSEILAATPKAVKAAYDLAAGKAPVSHTHPWSQITGVPAASLTAKGTVQLSSAINSTSEILAATPKAVKAAYDLANGKQPADATLTALAGLATAADRLPYFTGADRAALATLTAIGRAIIAKGSIKDVLNYLGLGEGSALPVGVPVPWPTATPPAGWLQCNGATFTKEQYPVLARVYPTLRLPDLRGEFIRGWDGGRKVDTRAIIAKGSIKDVLNYLGLGEGSALPVGVPVPWPTATPPAGWLQCNGATFTKEQYPVLARVYPTLRLPDLRGEFIRGWDGGRKVDTGRALLSFQEGTIVSGFDDNDTGDISSLGSTQYGFGDALTSNQLGVINGKKWIFDASSKGAQRYDWWAYVSARPRNIAFNYIVRAA
ncbi:phage tail protein [Escherichia coli]|nr:phage tail protein [Escherichia coli]